MRSSKGGFRLLLAASTAIWVAAAVPAVAQSALNLGSVIATGNTNAGGGNVAPSATGSLKQAQQLKKLAPNVISVLPQSQIEKNPDVNIADAFARIPGVSLVSDSGEGQFIDIRGLDADLDGTTFDGLHLTANDQGSPSGNERAPDLGVFPSGIVGGVEVVKSLTPDMDAEGLGGSANILPIQLPANGGPLADITLAAGAETLRPTGIFQGNFQLGDSFAIPGMRSFANAKPFSVIVGYSYYSDRRGIDDFEESYDPQTYTAGGNQADLDNLQYRYYQEHRVRQGLYAEVDFNPTPVTGFFFRALDSGFTNQIDKDRLEFQDTDAPNATGPDGRVGSDGTFTINGVKPSARYTYDKYTVATDVLELGGHTVFNDFLSVNGTASYTQGSNVEPIDYVATFKGSKINGFTYNVTNPEYRGFSIADGLNTADPANYELEASGGLNNNPQYAFDQEWAAALNASFANDIFGGVGEAKFGAQARLRAEGDLQYNYQNTNQTNGPSLASVSGNNPELTYYNGHFTLPPFPNYGLLFQQAPVVGATSNPYDPNDVTGLGYADFESNLASFQHNSENVYAAYGQETATFGKVELLAGLRMEDTNGSYTAYAATDTGNNNGTADADGNINPNANTNPNFNASDINTYALHTNHQDYINLFPSAQFKYTFSDQFQVRAAYSTGIARPGFQQISGAETTVIGGGTNGLNAVTIGNPSLKPTTGNSFDLTAEYYGPYDSTFSGGVFYKTFNNYIFSTLNNQVVDGTLSQVTSFQNLSGAFARGLELDAHQRFYMLPDPIDGLGIDGNVTFVDSRGHADGTDFKAYQLPETSPITYNAELFYEKGPIYADVSVNYVSRSLFSVVNPASPANGFADLNPRDADNFTSARTTVDANLDYAVTPRITLFAQLRNITNTPLEFTQSASSQYPIQREFYDVDYLGGVRFKLGS